jgi:outer membrane lipoprotein-sorting protein
MTYIVGRVRELLRQLVSCLVLVAAPVALAQSASTQPATTPASPGLIERVQKQLSVVNTVESDFVQEKSLSVLQHKLTIKGRFAMQKPDRVIWIVREPVKYAIRVFGDEVRQWDEDANKVQVIHVGSDPTFKAISQQVRAWFMGDYAALAENYDVTVASEQPLTLAFASKAGSAVGRMMGGVEVTFAADGKYIEKMLVREAGGDVTTLQFLSPKVNEPVSKDTWEIPPNGR